MRYRIYSTSGVPYFSRFKLVPYFPVLHIPVLHFQRPLQYYMHAVKP